MTVTGTDGSRLYAGGYRRHTTGNANFNHDLYRDCRRVGGTTPASASATVTVVPPGTVKSINHVIFMLQENHTFDNYFGMLNPYRQNNGL